MAGVPMLAEERRTRIQELLGRELTVTISELADQFGTSEMTIRRDLDELESRGICQRVHGGAIGLRIQQYQNGPYPAFPLRERVQVREKVAIGRAAAALVSYGDTIAIDSGTTAAYMAHALRDQQSVTVITNSVRVMDQLCDVTHLTLISPGGTLSVEGSGASGGDLSFVGPIAVSTLRKFRVSKAFISTSGLTVSDGISNASLFQAEIKRTLIDIADQAILITDHSKFGRVSGFVVAKAEAFHQVITDVEAPAEEVERLRELGVQVTLVEPASEALLLQSCFGPLPSPVEAPESH